MLSYSFNDCSVPFRCPSQSCQLNSTYKSLNWNRHSKMEVLLLNIKQSLLVCITFSGQSVLTRSSLHPHLLLQLWHCCSHRRSSPTCHKWHFTGIRFPVVNFNAGSSAGCGQWTWGRSLAIKRRTEEDKRAAEGKALRVITHLKQMCCLWMWYLEISLQFSWQPPSAPTQHSLLLSFSLSVRPYLFVTDTFRQLVEGFWTPYMLSCRVKSSEAMHLL